MAVGFYLLAMQSSLNIGYRHVLPALPYLLLLIAGLGSPELATALGQQLLSRRLLAGGAFAVVVVALWIYPNYLSYFNVAVGGPKNGYRILTDSNVDWGQDLLRLKAWMNANGVESVQTGLVWHGQSPVLCHRP